MTLTLYPPALHLPARRDIWLPSVAGLRVVEPAAPRCFNPDRREAGRESLRKFKKLYFPWHDDQDSLFHGDFLELLQFLIRSKGILNQSVAAKRGIGKTEDVVIASVWAKLYRHRLYEAWICKKIEYAQGRIGREAYQIQNNKLLAEDFPEICNPFIGVDVRQVRAPLSMTNTVLFLPNGTCSMAYTIAGALRGLALDDGTRPDWVNLDDVIETVDGSEVETESLEAFIEQLAGLAESGGDMATLMQVTVPQVDGVADIYTDPVRKPGWNGMRWRTMLAPPEATAEWERFVALCNLPADKAIPPNEPTEHEKLLAEEAAQPIDVAAVIGMDRGEYDSINIPGKKHALYYYAQRKAAMDEGCIMIDRSSPVYDYYATLARTSKAFIAGEWDQHPIAKVQAQISKPDFDLLQTRCLGPQRGTLPEWAMVVLASIDIGKRKGLHWEVDCFGEKGQWSLVDWGISQGALKNIGFDEAKESAQDQLLEAALIVELEEIRTHIFQGYKKPSGEVLRPALVGADVGGTDGDYAWQPLIVRYCYRQTNAARFRPMKGHDWKPSNIASAIKSGVVAGQWFRQDDEKGGVYLRNKNYWMTQVHDSQSIPPVDKDGLPMPGARIFCNAIHDRMPPAERANALTFQRRYFHHLCNAEFTERLPDDYETKLKVGWNPVNGRPVDWFSTAAMVRNLFEVWKFEQRSRRVPVASVPRPQPRAANPMYS